MSEGKCTKNYPKRFTLRLTKLLLKMDMFAIVDERMQIIFKNKDIYYIPIQIDILSRIYNPFLSKSNNCHINVESASIRAMKYIHKYIFKGFGFENIVFDCVRISRVVWNEINIFQKARYILAPEAMWRTWEFKTNHYSHAIIRSFIGHTIS